uniref:Uncharacterized protein n=1 Tax=Romanomermis culicivorax TaxID=13658 RepID=A0A915K7Q6_ROMCU
AYNAFSTSQNIRPINKGAAISANQRGLVAPSMLSARHIALHPSSDNLLLTLAETVFHFETPFITLASISRWALDDFRRSLGGVTSPTSLAKSFILSLKLSFSIFSLKNLATSFVPRIFVNFLSAENLSPTTVVRFDGLFPFKNVNFFPFAVVDYESFSGTKIQIDEFKKLILTFTSATTASTTGEVFFIVRDPNDFDSVGDRRQRPAMTIVLRPRRPLAKRKDRFDTPPLYPLGILPSCRIKFCIKDYSSKIRNSVYPKSGAIWHDFSYVNAVLLTLIALSLNDTQSDASVGVFLDRN